MGAAWEGNVEAENGSSGSQGGACVKTGFLRKELNREKMF